MFFKCKDNKILKEYEICYNTTEVLTSTGIKDKIIVLYAFVPAITL